jgi:O-methyltransferase.
VPSPLPIQLSHNELCRVHPLFTKSESYLFNRVTELFLNYIYVINSIGDLERVEEPLVGNPPFVLYNNRRVSQDIFNSILEKNAIQTGCDLNHVSTIYEVGAGSGRTAFTLLTLYPHLKYVIIDIPPALYISQTYLSRVFSERNIMKFRPFSTFEGIEEEFSQADICFITPDQLNLLQRSNSSLFLAIDCIHEMKPETIEMYFNHADRLCDWIYFKCWQKTVMPFDNIVYNDDSYPVLLSWKKIFHEPTVVPSDFFHAMYLIE